jgi:hypothetical protein
MPGERAVLERLTLELEILNRRAELREARKARPVLAYEWEGKTLLEERAAENRRHLDELERQLAAAVASRPKRETPWRP